MCIDLQTPAAGRYTCAGRLAERTWLRDPSLRQGSPIRFEGHDVLDGGTMAGDHGVMSGEGGTMRTVRTPGTVLAAITVLVSGCMTLTSGRTQWVTLNSSPPGATANI